MQPEQGARDISEELKGPPEDILHVGGPVASGAGTVGTTDTEGPPESAESTMRKEPTAGTKPPPLRCGSKSTQKSQLVESDNFNLP